MGTDAEQALARLLDYEPPQPKVVLFVVDDEDVICHVLERLLTGIADEIRSFYTGDAALEGILADPPAVVITDKNLPDLTGLDLVRLGKQHSKDTEFIIVTGYASVDSAIEAIDLGACGYIKKPLVDLEEVKARVVSAVNRYRAVAQNRLLSAYLERAYVDLYRAKVEIDIQNDITEERLSLRANTIKSLLEELTAPLGEAEENFIEVSRSISEVWASRGEKANRDRDLAQLERIAISLRRARSRGEDLAALLAGDIATPS